jgi:drug/metabolite transporter (DMT)-like permease
MTMSKVVKNGAYLALATAVISGVSVYVNSFGVKRVPDPFVFTTAKNAIVAMMLVVLVVAPFYAGELRRLSRGQWARLALIGLIGGSVPFLMFFYGLKHASAPSAAFMHKTLFIWVALLAIPLLGERLGRLQIVALATLVVGNLVLVGLPARWQLGTAELFTLGATMLWAAEAILARRFLTGGLSTPVAALGRMGFGALIMLGFVVATGRGETMVTMTASNWGWVLLTSLFLMAYVVGYYSALKRAPATLVASVLVLGSVITSLLHVVFSARTYAPEQIAGIILIVVSCALWLYLAQRIPRAIQAKEANYARG